MLKISGLFGEIIFSNFWHNPFIFSDKRFGSEETIIIEGKIIIKIVKVWKNVYYVDVL